MNPLQRTVLKKTHCTIDECAYLLSKHRNTIRNYLDDGIFTKIKPKGGRSVYIDLSEIERYLVGEEPIMVNTSINKEKLIPANKSKRNKIKKPRRRKKKSVEIDINSERFTYINPNDKARDAINKSFGKDTENIKKKSDDIVEALRKSRFHYNPKPKKFYKRKPKSDETRTSITKEEKAEIMKRKKLRTQKRMEESPMYQRNKNKIAYRKNEMRGGGRTNKPIRGKRSKEDKLNNMGRGK